MDAINWTSSILSILAVLGIIAGFWIAGRFLPACITWIHSEDHDDLLSHPFAKIILWLGLGALFTLPLLDLVRWLGNLVNVVLVLAGQGGGEFSTLFGPIPSRVYYGFNLFLMLAVYGIIVWFTTDYLSTPGQFNQTERIFIVLSIASLVYRGVSNIFIYIFSFQFPITNVQQNYGITGFLFEVVVGIAIVTVTLVGLNRFLPNHPASAK